MRQPPLFDHRRGLGLLLLLWICLSLASFWPKNSAVVVHAWIATNQHRTVRGPSVFQRARPGVSQSPPPPALQRNNRQRDPLFSLLEGSRSPWIDYEYLPPDDDNNNNNGSPSATILSRPYQRVLSSTYDTDNLPASLRAEAVRSALRSGRCIAYDLASDNDTNDDNDKSTNFGVGWVQLHGPGYRNVLHNLLATAFVPAPAAAATTTTSTGSDSSSATAAPTTVILDGTHTNQHAAAWLTSKGHLRDLLNVVVDDTTQTAHLFTSPGGHAATELAAQLEQHIFPLDQVTVTAVTTENDSTTTKNSRIHAFSLASTQLDHVQDVWTQQVWPQLLREYGGPPASSSSLAVPSVADASRTTWTTHNDNDDNNDSHKIQILLVPTVWLPAVAAVGTTVVVQVMSSSPQHQRQYQHPQALYERLTDDRNPDGPIGVGPLEYESLRIEAGWPRFGTEFTAVAYHQRQQQQRRVKQQQQQTTESSNNEDQPESTVTTTSSSPKSSSRPLATPASPLELFLDGSVNTLDKGCYLGQEGIAALVKHPSGTPPRSLYQVVLEYDDYDAARQQYSLLGDVPCGPLVPQPGDTLWVLGTNGQLRAGTLTSVAEPESTGDAHIVALALIRRAATLLQGLRDWDLEPPSASASLDPTNNDDDDSLSSGIIMPPPLDPLDGLEVIIYHDDDNREVATLGRLRSIPQRRWPFSMDPTRNMFVEAVPDFVQQMSNNNDYGDETNVIDVTQLPLSSASSGGTTTPPPPIESTMAENSNNKVPDIPFTEEPNMKDIAAAHPSNNESAMEPEETSTPQTEKDDEEDEDLAKALQQAEEEAAAAAAEAQRKAEKMKLLQERAAAAMARRKKKQQQKEE